VLVGVLSPEEFARGELGLSHEAPVRAAVGTNLKAIRVEKGHLPGWADDDVRLVEITDDDTHLVEVCHTGGHVLGGAKKKPLVYLGAARAGLIELVEGVAVANDRHRKADKRSGRLAADDKVPGPRKGVALRENPRGLWRRAPHRSELLFELRCWL